MVKFILIKSPDEWATTKQACRDELVVYLSFSSIYIYIEREREKEREADEREEDNFVYKLRGSLEPTAHPCPPGGSQMDSQSKPWQNVVN